LPLEDAKRLYRTEILPAFEADVSKVDEILRRSASSQRARRILHLSDFHFGTRDAARRRAWLKERLAHVLPTVDRVVVTGDLFDEPKEAFRELFDDFRSDVENIAHKGLLVIPGNHDVRKKGNAWWRWGRNSEYISDLQWTPVVFDDELKVAFISFNSSSTGNFARGTVTETQRRDRGIRLDKELRKRPEVADYLKVALVHHHPYAYGSQPTALYEKLMAELFGGEEKFIAFEEAQDFMQWCATRGVSLVLHGHKHVPHVASVHFSSQGKTQEITVVGCGSSTGVDGKPMCYDIITMDASSKKWNVLFYHDPKGDGSGFSLQSVAVDVRQPMGQNVNSRAADVRSVASTGPVASPADTGGDEIMVDIGVEAEMTDENTGSLVFRFWELTSSQRRKICLQLGLLQESEIVLPEPERYKRALLRVVDREKLEELAREVARAENE